MTAVDVSAFALELAAENGKRNGLTNLDYKCADVFDLLTEMSKEKKCDYDYIILDPPKTLITATRRSIGRRCGCCPAADIWRPVPAPIL